MSLKNDLLDITGRWNRKKFILFFSIPILLYLCAFGISKVIGYNNIILAKKSITKIEMKHIVADLKSEIAYGKTISDLENPDHSINIDSISAVGKIFLKDENLEKYKIFTKNDNIQLYTNGITGPIIGGDDIENSFITIDGVLIKNNSSQSSKKYFRILHYIQLLSLLLATIFSIIFLIKRLHDFDKSGGTVLLLLIPIFNIILLGECFFMKGSTGENRYGKNPLTQ